MPVPVIPIGEPEEPRRRTVIPIGGAQTRVDDFGPWAGWEWDFARKHPLAYPLVRTGADIFPFASKIFPSGRKEFREMSMLGKTVDVGLDTLIFIPGALIGKGIKVAASPVLKPAARLAKAGKKHIPFRIRKFDDYSKSYLDEMAQTMDKFVYKTPFEQAIKKYKLGDGEARALLRGESSVWTPASARSGFMVEQKTPALSKLFTKEGTLKEKVAEKLTKWNIPPAQQRLNHMLRQYEKKLKPLVPDEASIKAVFNSQVNRLFGKKAKGLTMENIGGQDMSKVLMELLINRGRVVNLDISSWHWIMPARKVFGLFDPAWKTFAKIYKPAVKAYGASNEAAVLSVEKFHKLLYQRGLVSLTGKAGAKGFEVAYKKGKWIENYTKEHAQVAGKALAKMDDMQGMKVPQEEINAFVQSLPGIPQRLVKAFQVWTDYMYSEFMKVKIPQLFRRAGLNSRGRAAIRREMDKPGKGLNRSISGIFSDEANLAYGIKEQYVNQILKDLRNIVEKNRKTWFDTEDGIDLLLKELTPRKPKAEAGFINYLRNYSPRLFTTSRKAEVAPKAADVPGQMTASFVKARTADVAAPGRVEDYFELVAARARQQGRELHFYPELAGMRAAAKDLPPKLRAYTGHYFTRLLGMSSKVDQDVAKLLMRATGGQWDARRVMNLSWKINDIIYMGGIGFKPFSAMRNLMQPILNTPADLGGVKDFYWLARGFRKGLHKSTWDELKAMGAITEYSPDILFRPVMSKLKRQVKLPLIGTFGIPRKETVRDASMYMFKKADQWNRLWTGAAAMEKWDFHYAAHMVGKKNIKQFKKKLNLGSREAWVRADIEDLIEGGSAQGIKEARELWIKDVVADTQYLYGAADSPLIGQVGGGVTKTAVVFQSWWMNYGTNLGKWLTRTDSVPKVADRYFTWMLSSAMIMTTMENYWGRPRARATAFLGPLPSTLDAPASWRPILETMNVMRLAGEAAVGMRDIDEAKKKMWATAKTAAIIAPGGLFGKQVITGLAREGWSGAFKEAIGYRGPPEK